MAVAMEVASCRGGVAAAAAAVGELTPDSPVRKKWAWGADAQQLMQLMMGQLQNQTSPSSPSPSPSETPEFALDLLGKSGLSPSPSAGATTTPASEAADSPSATQLSPFLHLDPSDSRPLPSGWEKCLDLQTGKLYFLNKTFGVRTFTDPRTQPSRRDAHHRHPVDTELAIPQPRQQQEEQEEHEVEEEEQEAPHEFLASKKSETESLRGSSSSSGSPTRRHTHRHTRKPRQQRSQHHVRPQKLWSLMNSGASGGEFGEQGSNVELDLNLAAGGSATSPREQSVCTMEMIQNALRRSCEGVATVGKRKRDREVAGRLKVKGAGSSSFSSMTNSTTRSDPSGSSPASSTSSSVSSLSGAGLCGAASAGVCEAEESTKESTAGALVMGACTRCLMYVMLTKADPRCPRCDSKVPVDYFAPPCKKQRGGLQ